MFSAWKYSSYSGGDDDGQTDPICPLWSKKNWELDLLLLILRLDILIYNFLYIYINIDIYSMLDLSQFII